MKSLNWLHISDFHCGQGSQWLWNNFKHVFLADLEHVIKKIGRLDLVIFSGDLTQRGSEEEFNVLTSQLIEMWEVFRSVGSDPLIFHVPGNHDLVRPAAKDARVKMLAHWQDDPDIPAEFWADGPSNQYKSVVTEAFGNYMEWSSSLHAVGIKTPAVIEGIIPGDRSASVEIDGISVGIIGLNSAFLHYSDNMQGKLELDLRQLNALTENNPPAWLQRQTINLLVTHHPPDWLSKEAGENYSTEIFPSGRFLAHLYGHMHEPDMEDTKKGGSKGRRFVQAASLFGMEYFGDGTKTRLHGYSCGQVIISDNEAKLRLWPRIGSVSKRSKDRKIAPDHENFDLKTGEEFTEDLLFLDGKVSSSLQSVRREELSLTVEVTPAESQKVLETTRTYLGDAPQHVAIRLLEQRACIDGLKKNRLVWISADWGLGLDGFIWSVLKSSNIENLPFHRISLKNYTDRGNFITQFAIDNGCSFAEYSTALASAGEVVILLEDAPVSAIDAMGGRREHDALKLAQTLLDFCSNLKIFVSSRTRPVNVPITTVTLSPLDEAETRSYLLAHPSVGGNVGSPEGVNLIFRRSGGLPSKIDSGLKKLRVLSLAELADESAMGRASVAISGELVPDALVRAVAELRDSKDGLFARSFLLLKFLAVLPHGESIERLKRIEPTCPIFSSHAELLLDRDLVQVRSSTISLSNGRAAADRLKIIFAPQPVIEYILSLMSQQEILALVKKAIVLYFGDEWRTGHGSLRKLSGILVSDEGALVANPHSLVLRLLADDATWAGEHAPKSAFNLCRTYTSALLTGKHYRSAVIACKEVLAANDNRFAGPEINDIEFTLAQSLRMSGEHQEAREYIEKLLKGSLSNERKAHMLTVLAMIQQRLEDPAALQTARSVIEIKPDSANALQAKSIILELEEDKSNKRELVKLELEARKRGFDVVANNIALGRVSTSSERQTNLSFDVLNSVYSSAIDSDDKYTAARAMEKIGRISLHAGRALTEDQVRQLMETYEYLYGERFESLFESVHKSLWEYFESLNDVPNLLSLFRHSSFIWRLYDNDQSEKRYSDRLIAKAKKILAVDILKADKNTAYFLLRTPQGRQDD